MNMVWNIIIDLVSPHPSNVRQTFDEGKLNELAESIKEYGVLEPLLVTTQKETPDRYTIICGERRWRAAKLAGLNTVPCVVINDLTPAQITEAMLIENLQREDLSPIEEAKGYARLLEEAGYTQEQLAEKVGKSQPYIANRLRLLRLPEDVQARIPREIPVAVALALVKAARWPGICKEAADRLVRENTPARRAQQVVDFVISDHARPLFKDHYISPTFDPSIFDDHPDRIELAPYGRNPEPYLVNISAWEKAEKQARREKQAALEEQMKQIPEPREQLVEVAKQAQALRGSDELPSSVKRAMKDLPRLSKLGYSEYERLRNATFDTAECEGCEFRKVFLDDLLHRNDPLPLLVCTKPRCYSRKNGAVESRNRAQIREQLEGEYARLSEEARPWINMMAVCCGRNLLLYLAALVLEVVNRGYNTENYWHRLDRPDYCKRLWGKDAKPRTVRDEGFADFLRSRPDEELARIIIEMPALLHGANRLTPSGLILGDISPLPKWIEERANGEGEVATDEDVDTETDADAVD
jgi:ParB/RepB/Spo0J family partition protein